MDKLVQRHNTRLNLLRFFSQAFQTQNTQSQPRREAKRSALYEGGRQKQSDAIGRSKQKEQWTGTASVKRIAAKARNVRRNRRAQRNA